MGNPKINGANDEPSPSSCEGTQKVDLPKLLIDKRDTTKDDDDLAPLTSRAEDWNSWMATESSAWIVDDFEKRNLADLLESEEDDDSAPHSPVSVGEDDVKENADACEESDDEAPLEQDDDDFLSPN